MGLLEHLWDDTVAGPKPESGLGKLRKPNSFSFRSNGGKDQIEGGTSKSFTDDSSIEGAAVAKKVTRSIMIIRPPGYQSGSPPVSPAGSTTPGSPFSGSREPFRFRRRSTSDAYEKTNESRPGSSTPPYNV